LGGDDKTLAKITLDHLSEDPKYYDKLEKVENINPSVRTFPASLILRERILGVCC
jgi:hypothetical protein